MKLDSPLREIPWITPQRATQFERFGLATAEDLLTHFPRRYEDRRRFDRFPQQESETPVCVCGTVTKIAVKRFSGWKKLVEATLEESDSHALSEPLVCRWFNAHFVQKMLATGQRLVVFGKPKLRGKRIMIDHPEFEIVENDDISIHLGRITPVYRATEGLSQRTLRQTIFRLLDELGPLKSESRLPGKLDPTAFGEALREIHFPETEEKREAARRHLVLAEFFAMQLFVGAKRAQNVAQRGEPHCGEGELLARFLQSLPFPLTGAQERSMAEIRADLQRPQRMNRLLHGDVGSGKTVVALSAMLLAVEAGYQAALMAPTQILADQHYLNFSRLLEPLGIRVALRTGARSEESGPLELWAAGKTGDGAAAAPGSARGPRAASGGPPVAPGTTYHRRRLPHFEQPWAIYAIAFSTLDRRRLNASARSIVLDCILHWRNRRYELFAACVMPDHVHLLIQPMVKENDAAGSAVFFSLSEIMQTIKSFTAHRINEDESESGSLWDKVWFDRYVRSDRDLEEKFQYIVENPWSSGVVSREEDYAWIWSPGISAQDEATSPPVFPAGRRKQNAGRVRYPEGNSPIVIGTHALLYERSAAFEKLGLIVIDEQHKFGVMQRARLIEQGDAPDVLVMTATPIPRTLTMTVYGDLDVSTLDEMPANRGKIVTAVRDESKLAEIVPFIRQQLDAGRQAYVVYPLIDESVKLEAKAAATEFEKWKTLLAPMRCELLHGRIEAEEKDAIMERFRAGETKALIATSVIEVGIDVPNANVMLIENAERFGLAQLHQLRGRIGRGAHKSFCILISAAETAEAIEKLKTLEQTADGFKIAEADLRLRGAGDILGTAQSGLPPLKLGDLVADRSLMELAREAAMAIFQDDPQLEKPGHQRFRDLIVERRKLMLAQVS